MLFRMPSEDLHIATKFDPGLSRLSESRCYAYPVTQLVMGKAARQSVLA